MGEALRTRKVTVQVIEGAVLGVDHDDVLDVALQPAVALDLNGGRIEAAAANAAFDAWQQQPPYIAYHVDIDVEAEHWDAARVRLHEATTDAMGRDLLVAAARHRASGELVGYSELTVSREQPQTAYQWDTLVVGRHRGHRLGGLLKVTTMRLLEAGGYRTKKITTFNAAMNGPMIAVNEAIGARVAGAMVAWRKDL